MSFYIHLHVKNGKRPTLLVVSLLYTIQRWDLSSTMVAFQALWLQRVYFFMILYMCCQLSIFNMASCNRYPPPVLNSATHSSWHCCIIQAQVCIWYSKCHEAIHRFQGCASKLASSSFMLCIFLCLMHKNKEDKAYIHLQRPSTRMARFSPRAKLGY